MATFQYSAPAELSADDVFGFLAEPGKLARHFPVIADAEGGPHIDRETRTLTWGDPKHSSTHGSLTVDPDGPGRCVVSVTLHADDSDERDFQRGVKETVAAVAHRAAAETDVRAADDQTGWV
ncbi:hypothetical protein B0I33_103183 [Prauserella shujinwangii]|uniref:Polyketide cyclase/dehydrase/lipid transport protein n=1 Tax=Prauserella shujinwangii TaxID=1453103 RepID=A0A2T0LYI2_9PSEU|nr:hypothetical protein [Prauserella shujinwangii]PRX49150.1 hypothetical protein B0I33_103183 [Prauserella shujinwangii]